MLAARFYEGDEELTVEEVPDPSPDRGEALVELHAASLCGTDMNYLDGKTTPARDPIILGHEGAGIIRETGGGLRNFEVGDRVLLHYIQSCGTCEPCFRGMENQCRNRESIGYHVDGTFAEAITVPERSLVSLPHNVPFPWGSITGCAVSTGFHAVKRSELCTGDTAVVSGVGGVGLHAVLWLDQLGAGTIVAIDPSDGQREAALEYGADLALDPTGGNVLQHVEDLTDGYGADLAIECSGAADAMALAVESVGGRNRYETGTVVCVGIQTTKMRVGFYDIREGQLRVSGDHTHAELSMITDLLEAGRLDLDRSITHRLGLESINRGVSLMRDRNTRVGRVVIETSL